MGNDSQRAPDEFEYISETEKAKKHLRVPYRTQLLIFALCILAAALGIYLTEKGYLDRILSYVPGTA